MSIRWKLLASYAVLVVAVAGAGVLVSRALSSVEASFREVREDNIPASLALADMHQQLTRYVAELEGYLLTGRGEEAEDARDALRAFDRADERYAAVIRRAEPVPENREMAEAMTETLERLREIRRQLEGLGAVVIGIGPIERSADSRTEQWKQLQEMHSRLLADASTGRERELLELAEHSRNVSEALGAVRLSVMLSIGFAVLLAAGWGVVLSRSIGNSVRRLTDATLAFAGGQLETRVTVRSRDEIGALGVAFNQMAGALVATTVSKEYVDTIVESMGEALLALTHEGRVRTVNEAACHILGYARAELVGRPIETILEEEGGDRRLGIADLLENGAVSDLEVTFRRKDGTGVPMAVSGSAMRDAEGRVAGCVLVARDLRNIRELMRAEREKAMELARAYQALKTTQAQLMQSGKLAAVGQLAAGVAHEINNPLTYVAANLDLALAGLEKHGQEPASSSAGTAGADRRTELAEIVDALREAHEGTRRIRVVVRDLKAFSRADHDRRGPVDVQRLLESSINMAFNEIRHHARLVKHFANVPPVEANDARLGQVFLNLLINAAQAIPEGMADRHEIQVATTTDADGRVVVEVRDTGSGIPQEIMDRIFEPFFTTKPVGVGTGLGLPICHGIVTALGGSISVTSEVGKGSVFRVVLPAARPDVPETRPVSAPVAGGRRGRVLIVDDEPMVGSVLRRILAPDHDLVVLTRAREALERIGGGERFDVILCDLMMPEMTGMDLYEALVRSAPDQAERMVFLTGGAFTPRARDFLDRVPNQRIEKPFDDQGVRALVRAAVR
jgi:PAS domain S-box-containing protein